ncbi:MAG: nucleoside deaminase [Clostridia bacterium]|nr:nucleoside deaminase [Clostridia bacterium]
MRKEYFMRKALEEAALAAEVGEVPVGAVLVMDDEIISGAHNEKELSLDPTAHAEIIAIRKAAEKLGSWRLDGASIYVTIEPCAMCVGAMLQARVKQVVFGAPDPKGGAAGTIVDITSLKGLNHKIQVIGGLLEDDCREIIQDFFRGRRD